MTLSSIVQVCHLRLPEKHHAVLQWFKTSKSRIVRTNLLYFNSSTQYGLDIKVKWKASTIKIHPHGESLSVPVPLKLEHISPWSPWTTTPWPAPPLWTSLGDPSTLTASKHNSILFSSRNNSQHIQWNTPNWLAMQYCSPHKYWEHSAPTIWVTLREIMRRTNDIKNTEFKAHKQQEKGNTNRTIKIGP